jgi:aminoglycoside/choline kinase family phosphotransferase
MRRKPFPGIKILPAYSRASPTFAPDVPRDARTAGLAHWLQRILVTEGSSPGDLTISVASADASFRRYFRVARGRQTWIAMDAPPGKEDIGPFISIAQRLVGIGVNAPLIHERNLNEGYLLLSDFGQRTYLMEIEGLATGPVGINAAVAPAVATGSGSAATAAAAGATDAPGAPLEIKISIAPHTVEQLYCDALAALIRIQANGDDGAAQLPAYDRPMLKREMDLFPEWFVGKHLGLSLSLSEQAELTKIGDVLIDSALGQPQVFVHRDYHSRNLMVCEPGRPGILDFQDAVKGAITYDLVSLLRDCYVTWSPARVRHWIGLFRTQAARSGLPVGRDEAEFTRWFDFMGVQRHLKVAGIFSRLWHRDGKRGYLKDIPRTVDYLLSVCRQHAELQTLTELLEGRILPAMKSAAAAGGG